MNLAPIQHLFEHDGPFVTVHMDVSRAHENADQQIDARWQNTQQELEQAGVDGALIEQIGSRLREQTEVGGEVRRTIVAADGEIVFDDVLAGHSMWPETTAVGALPDLSGWLHQMDGQIPFLLVLADREGADMDFYQALARPDSEHQEVEGGTLHIRKVQVGGWAHPQYQRRSENLWQENAREVADAVREAFNEHRPRLIILAGDERARGEIAEALEGLQADIHHVTAGGRAAGSSEEALWDEIRQVLAQIEATEQQKITGELEEKAGQGAGAALGLDEVIDALVQRKVERLIVDLQKAQEMTVDPKKHPGLVLPGNAAGDSTLRADQVLVAAGAASDAELSVVPAEQAKGGGVAAVLRWAS